MTPIVLIPAAGASTRFLQEGYKTPKPALKIRKPNGGPVRTMLRHVQDTIPLNYECLFGLNTHTDPDCCDGNKWLIRETSGQADTVRQMLNYFKEDRPVLIQDCDMLLDQVVVTLMGRLLEVYDMTVAVTKTFDPNASRVDQIPFPTFFVEKEPISEWGIVGVRGFKSSNALKAALDRALREVEGEVYLSHAMNYVPGSKVAIMVRDFTDWGTPARLASTGAVVVE